MFDQVALLLNENIFFPVRESRLEQILLPHLSGLKTILDVGSGNGRIDRQLGDKLGVKITGVDKHLQKNAAISVIKSDGNKLPFKDNSFDGVMLIDVLHHDEDPEHLFKEVTRVARKCILIKDHYFDNRIDWWLLVAADYYGNKAYGVDLPYKFLDLTGWKRLITQPGLKVVSFMSFRDFLLGFLFKQMIIKLEK